MSQKNPYKSFPNFVLRTPLYPFNFFKELTSNQIISDDEFKKLFAKAEIKEAIFLATPILFNELVKWFDNKIEDPKKIEKLKFSLLKYISRMSSRCTPFGLFAGCAVGHFDSESKVVLNKISNNSRHTRLDMNYLVALSQNLVKDQNIKQQILFYPNTSIYKSGNQLRYVEFEYVNSLRHHHIIAVDDSIYLEKVLLATKNGLLLKDILDLLIDNENSEEEVTEFVEELIDSQILTNELEPSVSGPEFLEHIIAVLSKIKNTDEQLKILRYIEDRLVILDNNFGNNPQDYIDISIELKNLKTDFDIKYLFQTDVILNPKTNTLDFSIVDSVKKGMSLLNKITVPPKETVLSIFKDAFYDRFEEREVLLSKVLDVEVGLGYKQNQNSFDINPLIDDIALPFKDNQNAIQDVKWTKSNSIFQKKLIEAFTKESHSIVLSDKDFQGFDENWDDLPDTISAMIEITTVNDEKKILITNIGGSSAANLLGRFCHGDQQLNSHTQSITKFEKDINENKILAEIVHLPESRVGNVLMRPIFREYEIPYLAKSVLENDKQVTIDDLYISVRNKKMHLRSKKHGKEVLPRLTNAHNYSSSSSLPIYHFLSDMQTQNKRAGLGINLGPFVKEYDFIPRIEYNDLILSEALWNLKKADIEASLKFVNQDAELINEIRNFRINKRVPQYIMLVEGDNELVVNLENLISIRMFLNTIKNNSGFRIKEFLYDEDGIVRSFDGKEYYTNQVVLSFYNSEKLKNE